MYWREDTNVKNVAKLFITDHLLLNTIKFILVRSPTIVKNVSKIFIKKTQLVCHQRIHTVEKPYLLALGMFGRGKRLKKTYQALILFHRRLD